MYKFTLPYTSRSKKNNRPIFFNRKTKRPFLGKSKKYKEFETQAIALFKKQKEELKIDTPITKTVKTKYLFYYSGAQKADLCNLITTLNDIIQDAGIIENDKQIKSIEGAEIFANSGVDRCEVFLIVEDATSKKPSGKVSFDAAKAYLQSIPKKSTVQKKNLQGSEKKIK